MPSVFSKNSKSNEKNFAGVEIDFMDVKPLLLENVMVKAKKMKSKNMKELETVEHESDAKSESNLDDLVMSEKN